jgi:hypothetical protein
MRLPSTEVWNISVFPWELSVSKCFHGNFLSAGSFQEAEEIYNLLRPRRRISLFCIVPRIFQRIFLVQGEKILP